MNITEEQILNCDSIEDFRAITLALFNSLKSFDALRAENAALKAENLS